MRVLKCLVPVMAVTIVFAVGSGSGALATELCKSNVTSCGASDMWKAGQAIPASLAASTSSVLKTSKGIVNPTITCTGSSMSGKTTNTGKPLETVIDTIETLTFTGCTDSFGNNCTLEAVGLPYEMKIHAHVTGGGSGTTTVEHEKVVEGGSPGLKTTCGSMPVCTFTATTIELDAKGSSTAPQFIAKEEVLGGSAFPCPGEGKWTATYTISGTVPLFFVNF